MIRFVDVQDGEFRDSSECQLWLQQVIVLLSNSLGSNPEVKLGAYLHGGAANLTLDIFSREAPTEYLAITIVFIDGQILLPSPSLYQMDIVLPGLVDAFSIAKEVSSSGLFIVSH